MAFFSEPYFSKASSCFHHLLAAEWPLLPWPPPKRHGAIYRPHRSPPRCHRDWSGQRWPSRHACAWPPFPCRFCLTEGIRKGKLETAVCFKHSGFCFSQKANLIWIKFREIILGFAFSASSSSALLQFSRCNGVSQGNFPKKKKTQNHQINPTYKV